MLAPLYCLMAAVPAAQPAAPPALVLNTRGYSWDARCTVESLQGLVNRAGPRLYLDYGNDFDARWLRVYAERNGLRYEPVASLRAALLHFRDAAKGFVVYDPAVDGSRCVAITMAGVDDLLPVSPAMLAGTAPELLSGVEWPGADFAGSGAYGAVGAWRTSSTKLTPAPGKGLWMQDANPTPGDEWGFATYGPVTVDLSRYPILEAQVDRLEGKGASWAIKLTWDRDHNGVIGGKADDLALPAVDSAGTQRWDIAKIAGLKGRHTFAYIQLHVLGPGARALWRQVRFVSRDGQAPSTPGPEALTDLLKLPVVHDLRGKFHDSVAAYAWALKNVMPHCDRRFAHSVDGLVDGYHAGYCQMSGFDWQVMHRGFVFNLCAVPTLMKSYGNSEVGGSPEQAAMYKRILAALKSPAMINGYGEPEGAWCKLISENGDFSFHFGPNWSFHSQIKPRPEPIGQRHAFTVNNVQPEPKKFYVCFMTSEGDTMKGPIPFFFDSWFDKYRGKVPMNWGINPLMAEYFPAMLQYYYETATPDDYFFAGCSGAGYTYPDNMPNLGQFAEFTARACHLADIPCIDAWGMNDADVRREYLDITKPLGLSINAPPARMELGAGGTPVAYHGLAYWQETFLNTIGKGSVPFATAFRDEKTQAAAVTWAAKRIEEIAAGQYPPTIILVYADLHSYAHHCQLAAQIADRLDPARFKVARLDEAYAAWRKWAQGRILVGSGGLNQHLNWSVLAGTPTHLPLELANAGSSPLSADLSVRAGDVSASAEETLGGHESRQVTNIALSLPADGAPDRARLTIRGQGKTDHYDASLTVVPRPAGLQAKMADAAGLWASTVLRHVSGHAVEDADALGRKAWATPAPPAAANHVVFGPYASLEAGRYLVSFRLKLPAGAAKPAADAPVGTLEVFTGGYSGLGKVVASRDLKGADLGPAGQYRWYGVEANWPGSPSQMETRVMWAGKVPLVIDRVAAFRLH